MKKVFVLLICLLLVGCGKESVEDYKLSMEKVTNTLSSISSFSDSENINDIDLISGYGIDVSLMEEYAFYVSSSVEDPSMYMIFKPIEEKTSIVKFQVNDMLDKYLNAYKGYYPEAVPMIEDRLEKEENGYLIYIISNDNDTVYEKIKECKE